MEPHESASPTCCSPAASRGSLQVLAERSAIEPTVTRSQHENMVALPGGEFLMGTNYADGFAADGERPVRRVHLKPFLIDRETVTNKRFAEFIESTGYKTEAEMFGWSFVFWSHIPPERFRAQVADTVAAAPWWCQVPGAFWNAPEGPGSDVTRRLDHPVVHV